MQLRARLQQVEEISDYFASAFTWCVFIANCFTWSTKKYTLPFFHKKRFRNSIIIVTSLCNDEWLWKSSWKLSNWDGIFFVDFFDEKRVVDHFTFDVSFDDVHRIDVRGFWIRNCISEQQQHSRFIRWKWGPFHGTTINLIFNHFFLMITSEKTFSKPMLFRFKQLAFIFWNRRWQKICSTCLTKYSLQTTLSYNFKFLFVN